MRADSVGARAGLGGTALLSGTRLQYVAKPLCPAHVALELLPSDACSVLLTFDASWYAL